MTESFKEWLNEEDSWGELGRGFMRHNRVGRWMSNMFRDKKDQVQDPEGENFNDSSKKFNLAMNLYKRELAKNPWNLNVNNVGPGFLESLSFLVKFALNGKQIDFSYILPALRVFYRSDVPVEVKENFSNPLMFVKIFDDMVSKNKELWFDKTSNWKYPYPYGIDSQTPWLSRDFRAAADRMEEKFQSFERSSPSSDDAKPDHPPPNFIDEVNDLYKSQKATCKFSYRQMVARVREMSKENGFKDWEPDDPKEWAKLQAFDNPHVPDNEKAYCSTMEYTAADEANDDEIACERSFRDSRRKAIKLSEKFALPLGLKVGVPLGNDTEVDWPTLKFKGSKNC